jgi:hypothetical protein
VNFWVLEIFWDFPRPPRPRKIEKNRKNSEIHENPWISNCCSPILGWFLSPTWTAPSRGWLHIYCCGWSSQVKSSQVVGLRSSSSSDMPDSIKHLTSKHVVDYSSRNIQYFLKIPYNILLLKRFPVEWRLQIFETRKIE